MKSDDDGDLTDTDLPPRSIYIDLAEICRRPALLTFTPRSLEQTRNELNNTAGGSGMDLIRPTTRFWEPRTIHVHKKWVWHLAKYAFDSSLY